MILMIYDARGETQVSCAAIRRICGKTTPSLPESVTMAPMTRADPETAAPTRTHPARLWVPGSVFITEHGELTWGHEVGFNGHDGPFRHTQCGRLASVDDWTHQAWLVRRAALNSRLVDQHAIILPEALVDQDAQPHAYRWLSSQPLVCVSGLKWQRLVATGTRVYQVSYDVDGDRRLVVKAAGAAGPQVDFSAPWPGLINREHPRALDADQNERFWLDQLLRHLSDGVLSNLAVVNALTARALLEDGYGYRGAPAGDFVSVERIQESLRVLEALFAQIDERAKEQRNLAGELLRQVRAAPGQLPQLAVPEFGTLNNRPSPELTFPLSTDSDAITRLALDEQPIAELVLPASNRWFVDHVTPYCPVLPMSLERQLAEQNRQQTRIGYRPLIALLVLALLGLILWWLL